MTNGHLQNTPRKKISFQDLELVLMGHLQWPESEGKLGKKAELKGIDLSDRELFGVLLNFASNTQPPCLKHPFLDLSDNILYVACITSNLHLI